MYVYVYIHVYDLLKLQFSVTFIAILSRRYYVRIWIHTHVYTYIYICVCVWVYICTYTTYSRCSTRRQSLRSSIAATMCAYRYTHIYIYICICVCVRVYINTYTTCSSCRTLWQLLRSSMAAIDAWACCKYRVLSSFSFCTSLSTSLNLDKCLICVVSHVERSHVTDKTVYLSLDSYIPKHYLESRQVLYQCHVTPMGWLQLVGSIKIQVSCAKELYKRDAILQKRPIILPILRTVATP